MTLLLALGCTVLPPYGAETLAGFDQPDACGDLDFVIDSTDPSPRSPDDGSMLSVHVDNAPLSALAETLLAPGATAPVQLDLDQFPMTAQWIEGPGRKGAGVCPGASGIPDAVWDVEIPGAQLLLIPTSAEPSSISDTCTKVSAVVFLVSDYHDGVDYTPVVVTHSKSGATQHWTTLLTIGVPVPCRE